MLRDADPATQSAYGLRAGIARTPAPRLGPAPRDYRGMPNAILTWTDDLEAARPAREQHVSTQK